MASIATARLVCLPWPGLLSGYHDRSAYQNLLNYQLMTSEYALSTLDELNPWDQQPNESSKDYYPFCAYRNLGPKRTYAAVARDIGLSPAVIRKLATQYSWNDRTTAWDFYQDRIFQAELAERTRVMAKKRADTIDRALEAVNAPIEGMLARMKDDPEGTMDEIGAQNIAKLLNQVQQSARLLPTLINTELTIMGQPTQITEHTETQNVNYNDTQRLSDTLDALKESGVLDAFLTTGASGEIIDAEVVEVDDDGPDPEANGFHDRSPKRDPVRGSGGGS